MGNPRYWRFWQQTAIRMGDWKYLQAGERTYLFNVETDQHENKNLIGQYPGKAKMMKQKLKTWADDLFHPGIPDGTIGTHKAYYDHYFK